jgi:hypothetical protein
MSNARFLFYEPIRRVRFCGPHQFNGPLLTFRMEKSFAEMLLTVGIFIESENRSETEIDASVLSYRIRQVARTRVEKDRWALRSHRRSPADVPQTSRDLRP